MLLVACLFLQSPPLSLSLSLIVFSLAFSHWDFWVELIIHHTLSRTVSFESFHALKTWKEVLVGMTKAYKYVLASLVSQHRKHFEDEIAIYELEN